MIAKKPLIWFLIISFGLAWILFLLPIPFGEPGTQARQSASMICWALAMWMPGLAAILVTRFVAKESLRTLNLRRLGRKRFYLWAWLLPAAFSIAAGLLTLAFGAGHLDLEFTMIREAMAQIPDEQAISPGLAFTLQTIFAFTLAPLINTLFALGEELGWRGFLLPQLLPMGQWKAILLSGAIWGLWHAPAVLQGLNYPNTPILGVFLMIIFCMLLGTVFTWLYLETRSTWAPALAHGTLNAVAGIPLVLLADINLSVGGSIASPIGWIPMILFVGWLIWTRRLPAGIESEVAPAAE